MRLPGVLFVVASLVSLAVGIAPGAKPDVLSRWNSALGKDTVTVYFAKNERAASAGASLKAVAAFMKTTSVLDLEIEGNADSAERGPQNIAQARAESVAATLQRLGVQAPRLVTVGESDRLRAEPPTSESNRAKNRRVDIIPVPRDIHGIAMPAAIQAYWGSGFTVSPDGRFALLGQSAAEVFDLSHGVRVKTLPGGSLGTFSPNGRRIAAMRVGQVNDQFVEKLVVYDLFSKAESGEFEIPDSKNGTYALGWSPDSTRVACTNRDSLLTFDVSSPKPILLQHLRMPDAELASCLVWDPLDRFIAVGTRGKNSFALLNPKTLKPLHASLPVTYLHALAETTDGKYLASTDDTRTLTVWNTNTWQSRTMPVQELCEQMIPSPSGDRMLLNDFGGGDHEHVLLADLATMTFVAETQIPFDIRLGGYSVDGKTIYAADRKGWLCYSAKDLTQLPSLNPRTSIGYQIQVDPERNLVTILNGNGIQIWDAKTGKRTAVIPGKFDRLVWLHPSYGILVVERDRSSHHSRIWGLNITTGKMRLLATAPYDVTLLSWTSKEFAVGGVPFLPTNVGSPEQIIETFSLEGAKHKSIRIPTTEQPLTRGGLAYGGLSAIDLAEDGKSVVASTYWQDGFGQGYTYSRDANVFSMASGQKLKTYHAASAVYDIEFDPKDQNRIALVQAQTVSIVDASTGAEVGKGDPLEYSPAVSRFEGGELVAYQNRLELRLPSGSKQVFLPHPIVDAMALPKLGLIVSLDISGTMTFWNLKTMEFVVTVFLGRVGDPFAISLDGKCEGSPAAAKGVYQLVGAHLIPYAEVRSQLEVPGLIQKCLAKVKG